MKDTAPRIRKWRRITLILHQNARVEKPNFITENNKLFFSVKHSSFFLILLTGYKFRSLDHRQTIFTRWLGTHAYAEPSQYLEKNCK